MSTPPAKKQRCLFYTDGSVRPNPGHGGFGVYGFVYEISTKPKNQKHPFKGNLFFSDDGVRKEKGELPIHVHSIVEIIKSFNSNQCSNNEIELAASLAALQKAYNMPDLEKITIYTDSNYIVKAFNEDLDQWGQNGWKRKDGRPVAHMNEWSTLLSYKHHFHSNGIELKIRWVRGHGDDYGNIMSDLLANVGSNASRVQLEQGHFPFVTDILDKTSTYAEYRESYDNKDFIFHFKDLFFSSVNQDDKNYCFISNNEDDRERGKRSNTSIFIANFGYVPEMVSKVKAFYRKIHRNFTTTCCIKLNKLEDRDVLRLTDMIPMEFLLRPDLKSRNNRYSIVGSDGTFLEENILEFPFIINITKLSTAMQDMEDIERNHISIYDVTERFVKDKLLVVTNKDKFVDFSDLTQGKIVFAQKLLAAVGYDFPSYLALKKIEGEITKVELILQRSTESNFYTLFVKIHTEKRIIYSVNVPNKFLGLPVATGT